MQSSPVCQLLPRLLFIFQMMGVPRQGSLRSILCEGTDLDEYVQFKSQAEKKAFQSVSCSLTPQQLINTQQVLLQNLDARKVLSEVSFPRRLPPQISQRFKIPLWWNLKKFLSSKLDPINNSQREHALLEKCLH